VTSSLLVGERVGDLFELLAFCVVFLAIGEGCHEAEGEDGFGFSGGEGVHVMEGCGCLDDGKNFSTVARVGAGVSRLTSAIQKAEPRHMNITGM
jgi:hypothetical protein